MDLFIKVSYAIILAWSRNALIEYHLSFWHDVVMCGWKVFEREKNTVCLSQSVTSY